MLLASALVIGSLLVAPLASANVIRTIGAEGCSFASATVGSTVDFCSNLGEPGCTTLRVAGETFSWCD